MSPEVSGGGGSSKAERCFLGVGPLAGETIFLLKFWPAADGVPACLLLVSIMCFRNDAQRKNGKPKKEMNNSRYS